MAKNGPKMAIFWPFSEKSALGKQLKNLLESFLRHMFCFFVSQHIREGVDNLTGSSYLLTGEKLKKNPIYTHFVTFFGQNLKKNGKSKKNPLWGKSSKMLQNTFYAICFLCLCLSMCGEVLVTLLGHHKVLGVRTNAKTLQVRGCYAFRPISP